MKKNLLLLFCVIVFAACEKEHIGAGEEAEMLEKQYGRKSSTEFTDPTKPQFGGSVGDKPN